jgi:hypothetical protein
MPFILKALALYSSIIILKTKKTNKKNKEILYKDLNIYLIII